MIETNLRKIVNEYSEIIVSIEKIEMVEEEQVAKFKAKLKLFDETILWIREIWIKRKMVEYSYYWLQPDETVIIGWDNAPHHKEVSSYPHHKHIRNKIESSQETNLRTVLNFIKSFLG